jgi:hypothetical protein
MVKEQCLAEVKLEPVREMVWVSVELEVAFEGICQLAATTAKKKKTGKWVLL